MRSISVIIPAYNEENTIEKTISALKNIPEISEIIVVDDGSKDNTYKIAKACGVKVIRLHKNRGKGAALTEGIKEVKNNIVLMVDADTGESAKEVRKLVYPVLENSADMTIARFPKSKKKGGFGIVQNLSRWGIKKLTGLNMHSPLSGQRCLKKDVFDKIGKIADGFGVETALTIDAAKRGFKILEIETDMFHRESGRSVYGFLHRAGQFLAVVKVLSKRFFELHKTNY